MALSFFEALVLSVIVGIFLGMLLGVKFLVKMERRQKTVLQKIFKLEELIIGAEKKILARLKKR